MKHILYLVVLLAIPLWANSQTAQVTEQTTNTPINGVILFSETPKASAITNANGEADISSLKGALVIQVRAMGYKTITLSYQNIVDQQFHIQLEETSLNLDQVVVSATKWRQSSGEVVSKIVTITPKEVALQNPQTAADLLGVSGKVFIQKSQQGGGSPMIRGFATNRLIYTVDGVRMNNAIFRGGNIQNVINLDPFATESTEVLFGPGSVIYGSDAIGGAMSFQTLSPQLSLHKKPYVKANVATRYATANQEKTGHFDVNIGWQKWAMVTSFSTWNYDDLQQGTNGPTDYIKSEYVVRENGVDKVVQQTNNQLQIPSAYSQINLMQKVRFKPNKEWDFEYGFHFSQTSAYGRYDRHNRYKNGQPRYAEWDYGPQKWSMNNLLVTHTHKNFFYDEFKVLLALQSFEESRIDRAFNNDIRTTNTENVTAYSTNVDFIKRLSETQELFYGVELVWNDVKSTGLLTNITTNSQTTGPSRYPNSTWGSLGAYVTNEWKVAPKWVINAGARYNQFVLNSDFANNQPFYPLPMQTAHVTNGALTGSLGTVYRPNATWVFRANIGTAFRAPNVDDMGKVFDSEPGAVVVPNIDLQPEYAYNADFGVAKVFGNKLKVDATSYFTILNNAMVRRNYQLNGADSIMYNGQLSQVQAMQNAATAHVFGVQFGAEWKITRALTFLTDLNYQVGTEELSDGTISNSRHVAPFFGVSRLRSTWNKLTLEVNTQFQGERTHADLSVEEQNKDEIYAKDAQGNNYAPAWYTLNFKALYKFNKIFVVSGGIENITDQRYRPYSSGISGAGRNFILSVSAQF